MRQVFGIVFSLLLPASLAWGQDRASDVGGLIYLDPVRFHNITLVPVATTDRGPHARYTLLEAGLEGKTLAVREKKGRSSEAEVNAVEVRNSGQFAAFLLGGEMILGGKQDRIIQSDTVLPNDGKWHDVPVFCVEQGRWEGKDMEFKSGHAVAHGDLRKAAITGDQGMVWEEVARKNQAHGTQSATQTYRRTVQNADLRRKVAHHVSALIGQLPKESSLAGFVFGINGEIRVADVFGNPVLLTDLKEKLVASYVLEALEKDIDPNAAKLEKAGASEFLGKARATSKDGGKVSGRAKTYKKKGKGVLGTETVDEGTGKLLKESYVNEPEDKK